MKNYLKKILILSLCINLIAILGVGFIFVRHIIIKNNTTEVFSPTHIISKSVFNELKTDNDDIIFVGDSLTDLCEWSELFDNKNIKNRGISGDRTSGILDIINDISIYKPKKIFLMVGINDLNAGVDKDTILKNYKEILNKITSNSPETKIYIQSIVPINKDIFDTKVTNEIIKDVNYDLKKLETGNIKYINLFDEFIDNDNLYKNLTTDGIHLNSDGYLKWKELIKSYL